MKTQEQDLYHGAALTQIVEHKSFKAVNRVDAEYGRYRVNADRHVFVKYRTNAGPSWQFVFQPKDLAAIDSVGANAFVCLVCGRVTVCALTCDEFRQVVDVGIATTQSITVRIPKGGSCHVKGSAGALPRVVTHNSFPDKVFA